jgi:predicted lipoprotein with Yx(FWY)xxD motif
MTRAPFLVLACVALGAMAVGCGSDENSTSSKSAATPAATAETTVASVPAVVATKNAKDLGTILAASDGRTLYIFEADKGKTSACKDACAAAWPPLITKGSPTAKGSAKKSAITVIKRGDGANQVVYNGHPLYTYAADKDAEDAYGQELNQYGAEWYVLAPSGSKVEGGASSRSQSSSSGY